MAPHDDFTINSAETDLLVLGSTITVDPKDSPVLLQSTSDDSILHLHNDCEQPSFASDSIDHPENPLHVGILRHSTRYSSSLVQQATDERLDDEEDEDAQPNHWPSFRPSVHFIDDHSNPNLCQSLVTSINYRPYTEDSEIAELYYTSADFEQFRGEYRSLLKNQRRRKQNTRGTDQGRKSGGNLKNSSYWGSENSGSFYDSLTGLFSESVFDVAKEAMSILSGGANYSTSPQKKECVASRARQQQLLVDTLYSNLF